MRSFLRGMELCLITAVLGSARVFGVDDGVVPNTYRPNAAAAAHAALSDMPVGFREDVGDAAQQDPRPWDYRMGISCHYGICGSRDEDFASDIVGLNWEGALFITQHHLLTLSGGLYVGVETHHDDVEKDGFLYPHEYNRSGFTLMVGYAYSRQLSERWQVDLGVSGGLDCQLLDVDDAAVPRPRRRGQSDPFGTDDDWYVEDEWDDGQRSRDFGFTYAGYVCLGYRVSEKIIVSLGYRYRASTAAPKAHYAYVNAPSRKAGSLAWHEVHLGLTYLF